MAKSIKKPVTNKIAKTPVVMQLEAVECGAACLTMICAYYDLWIPLEKVRYDCGVSRDGSNAKNVIMAARSYGFTAKGLRLETDVLKKSIKFPCIIHWNFDHFIVVNGIKGNYVYINDPARGALKMPIEEFDEGFTGICLTFEPSEEFKQAGSKPSVFKYAFQRVSKVKKDILFVILVTLITSISSIISMGLSRIFLDEILPGKNKEWFVPFIIFVSVFSIIQIVVDIISELVNYRINGKLAVSGSSSFMWKVLHLPMEFFSQRLVGDIDRRKMTNESIAKTIVYTLAPMVLSFFEMLFYLVVVLRYSIVLTVIGISSIVFNIFISRIVSDKKVNLMRVFLRDSGKLDGLTVSGIEMIETIKSSGAEEGFFEKWSGYLASTNRQTAKIQMFSSQVDIIPSIVNSLMNTIILISSVYLVIKGEFTVGMVMAFQGLMASFLSPANSLISVSQTITEMRTDMERIEDVMNYRQDSVLDTRDIPIEEGVNKLSGNLEIKNISFGYSRLDEPLLKDFSLSIKQGQRISIVGASGSGKSTVAKLISGLYQPWSGEILFDGKKYSEINRNVFTGSVAIVNQDVTIFEDSIRNNISMWDSTIENFEIILAAKDAGIHYDIMQRDGGYNYKMSENGKDFSGGQKQRMEIARVLAGEPTLIILDEATSALDAKTEAYVVNSIKERGITCIVVAHRLSTIRDSDEIIVLNHGVIEERGTHEELYAKGGYYTELISND